MIGANTTPMPYMAMAMPCFSRGKRLAPGSPARWAAARRRPGPAARGKDQPAQAGRQAAQHRTEREQRHAGHVEALAAEQRWRTSRSAAARWRWPPGTRSAPRWLRPRVAERLPAMCGRATLATLVSSTSMNVASITVPAITHGLMSERSRAVERQDLRWHRCSRSAYLVKIVASTFMPGRRILLPPGIGSSTIFTGMRCTTLT